MTKFTLPCGHVVDETAQRYVSTDVRNFYTCRQCAPPRQYMAEPFHWREMKQPGPRPKMPEADEQEQSLRSQLADMVKRRRLMWNKKQREEKQATSQS